uniref:Pre-mRNA-processing factor 39 n=1 Tax=Timema monikensis TaxID=170555 RepID=A0A7R9HPH8_9NEOP|nr:unnamed protein product [Timema monikensis]
MSTTSFGSCPKNSSNPQLHIPPTLLEGVADSTTKSKKKSEAQKRKLAEGDTYDPSSPTSENSCDESPAAKRAAVSSGGSDVKSKPVKARKALPELDKYWKAVKEDSSDFTGWTYLLQYVDQENDLEAAREAYDAFLSHYPYCYGYWRKYADYEKRKGNKEKCEEVFERGLKAIPLSVDLWIHYLNYCKAAYADNEDHLRTQFEKAISACGMEFRHSREFLSCKPQAAGNNTFLHELVVGYTSVAASQKKPHKSPISDRLWESFIKWETEGKRLQNITAIYDRLLATPTQGYTNHFDNFQEHISNNPPQKVLSVDEFLTQRREVLQLLKQYDTEEAAPGEDVDAPPGEEPEEQPSSKTDEETTALRERIISLRRKIHKATTTAVADRWNFEEGIKRPYFHVKPLERCQLKNWKEYLDFEIEHGDHDRVLILFERCLIACALYEEFWIKFVHYLESKTGMDDNIRDVYERACTIHHPKKPSLHLHWAVYEESHKNYDKASDILTNLEKVVPNMLQVAYRLINLERRRGNFEKVCELYEHYITNSKNKVIANNLAINVVETPSKKSKGSTSGNDSGAHTGSHTAVTPSQQPPQPQSGTQPSTAAGQYPPPNYQGSSSSSSYTQSSTQGSYQGQYPQSTGTQQQPPAPYNQAQYNQQYSQSGDPNYANYQNWGYSQTGYGGYNQGWGNYNYY